jgi:hypothetical protein
MQNVTMRLDGDILHIAIDITKKAYDAPKSEMVATTQGWEPLAEVGHPELAVSMNLIRKRGGGVFHRRGGVA